MDKLDLVSDAADMDVTGRTPSPQPQDTVPQPSLAPSALRAIPIFTPGVKEGLDLVQDVRVSLESEVSINTAFPPYDPQISVTPSSPAPSTAPVSSFLLELGGRKRVVVLGSGDFGLALASKLVQANYSVVVASRNPNRSRKRVMECGARMATQGEALGEGRSKGVVVAVPPQHQSSLPLNLLTGKILIDVSNRNPKNTDPEARSQAENLQTLVPGARVVKAFNVLSAYTLSRGIRGSKEVPVCGDDEGARREVCGMVRDLGFDPVNRGRLVNAREVEMIPLRFFPEWKFAFSVSLVVWALAFIITVFEWDLCENLRNLHKDNATVDWTVFNNLAQRNVSISCSSTAITLLSLCYLPGVLAGYLQLYRGTKYSEFPHWMDRWLKGRKHLGLLMLFNAVIHALFQVGGNFSDSNWRNPTYHACGVLALVMAGILGLASLPSVSSSMTWREFSFVQSRLGWFTLLLAILHVVLMQWDALITADFTCYLPSIGQFGIFLPLLTVVMKVPLLMPCVDNALTNIRQGYERVSTPSSA